MTKMSKMIAVTRDEMRSLCEPFLGVMNELHAGRVVPADRMIGGALFAVGLALRQFGAGQQNGAADRDAVIDAALAWLLAGYDSADQRTTDGGST